ncbi:MAG: peptide chain release factor aRF-1 [Candidatus Woesearchaeota archaeon]
MEKAQKVSEKQRFKLKKFIKEIENHKGRGTELVSVYVPTGYDLNKISSHIAQEQGTATNIKSKQTRDNVISSLEKIIQHLKLYQKTPKNGLAIFAGNVAEREGQQDFQVWSIEPPQPLNQRLYRCDKEFVLEPLREMLADEDSYALIAMDRREATIALLRGKSTTIVASAESMVPGKFKAGGQSALRFARNRELAAKEFYQRIGSIIKDQLFEMKDLKGIIVGGPGPTKYEFCEGNFILTELKNKIIGIKDLSYTDSFGIQELLEKSQDILSEESVMEEKKVMQQFFEKLSKNSGTVTYGSADCRRLLEMGAVEILLLSDVLDEKIIDELIEIAEQFSSNVEIISTETREGHQLKDMGGYAAILRYDVGENS